MKKKKWLLIAAVLAAVLLALPGATDNVCAETTDAASLPVLRQDYVEEGNTRLFVLGSTYLRKKIGSIQFEGTLDNAPEDAWDVSQAQNGTVLAWITKRTGKNYELHIAGNGGVQLPENCSALFSGYEIVREINFNHCVSTSHVTNMSRMFS